MRPLTSSQWRRLDLAIELRYYASSYRLSDAVVSAGHVELVAPLTAEGLGSELHDLTYDAVQRVVDQEGSA